MPTQALKDFLRARPEGESDADTLAAWLSDLTTPRPIPLAGLSAYLRTHDLEDRLKAIAAGAAPYDQRPEAARRGLGKFLAHLADGRQDKLSTDEPGVAAQAAAVLGYLVSAGDMSAAQRDAIYILGGGRRHDPSVTAADVAAARAAAARAVAVDAFVAAVTAYLNEHAHPARADEALPLPTAEALAAFVAAAREAE